MVNDVRQTEIHTAEPVVPEHMPLMLRWLLKSHKSPGTDQIPAHSIKAGGRMIWSGIHRLIIPIWNKEELLEQWKEPIIVSIYEKGDKIIWVIIEAYHVCQLHAKFCRTSFYQG
jgi:hypothetical protein